MDGIYLDNNATTRPADQVVEAVDEANRRLWANPSSVHRAGQEVRRALDLARAEDAELLGCRERELVFTSGATESNNLALRGIAAVRDTDRQPRKLIVSTPLEHAAIREPLDQLQREGYQTAMLPATRSGLVDADALDELLAGRADQIALVSVHWANNETGVVQPIERIAAACRAHRVPLHTDATQAVGKLPVDFAELPVAAASFSAHKFHGPKGVGGLYVNGSQRLRPQLIGGPQERQRRGGTENVPAIIGMGVAARLARQWVAGDGPTRVAALRDRFEKTITHTAPDVVINAGDAPRLCNTSNLSSPGLEAEAMLILLSERGVFASAGAACSSGSLEPSPVLLAMGIGDAIAHGAVRLSLSRQTDQAQVDQAATIYLQALDKLRQSMPA